MLYCSVNSQQVNQLSITDRGFSYGDGLFTTAKITAGKVEMLTQHIQRLTTGCQKLLMSLPDFSLITSELVKVAQPYQQAVIKIVITAGQGGRGYSRLGINAPNVVIMISEFPAHYKEWQAQGITLGISEQHLGINPMLQGLKHLNRLEQVLLRRELDQRVEDDLVVCNVNNHVIETSCANLFYFLDDKLYTPQLLDSGVVGLMRENILKKCSETIIKATSLTDLTQASAMFICNSVMGIVPVQHFNGHVLSINEVANIQSIMMNKDISFD